MITSHIAVLLGIIIATAYVSSRKRILEKLLKIKPNQYKNKAFYDSLVFIGIVTCFALQAPSMIILVLALFMFPIVFFVFVNIYKANFLASDNLKKIESRVSDDKQTVSMNPSKLIKRRYLITSILLVIGIVMIVPLKDAPSEPGVILYLVIVVPFFLVSFILFLANIITHFKYKKQIKEFKKDNN